MRRAALPVMIAVLVAVLSLAALASLSGRRPPVPAEKPVVADRGAVRSGGADDHLWYVDPETGERAFIGSPSDADAVMKRFGLGVSAADLALVAQTERDAADAALTARLRGRIILDVEHGGNGWYVDPRDGRRRALGAPEDAFRTLLAAAAPITKEALKDIPVSTRSPSWLRLPQGFTADIVATGFAWPRVLAWDPAGHLVMSDFGEKSSVIALADPGPDGAFRKRTVLARNMLNAHGLAFTAGRMYVAKEHYLEYWAYDPVRMRVTSNSTRIMQLPAGGVGFPGQGHKTRTVVLGADGMLYLSIGSTCDHCADVGRESHAVIKRLGLEARDVAVVARGLRNTVFLVQHPKTGEWWGNDNGRDDLGDDAPPDELNRIVDGGDYGWPLCYGDRQPTPDNGGRMNCAETTPPAFAYPAHSAPLGLRFIPKSFAPAWEDDLLSSLHGSTVRQGSLVGYKIVRLRMDGGRPADMADFATGFLRGNGIIVGRPVDLLFSADGTLYVTDDFAKVIHRIRPLR